MPAFCGEDVMMRQFWEISTAKCNREWTRIYAKGGGRWVESRQETFAGAACLPTDRAASW
jgi:hypothetical protein